MTNDNQDSLRCADRTSEICTALRRRPVPLADYIPHIQAQADHIRRLVAENEAKDALLRQAVETLAKGTGWMSNQSLIVAIRQTLGGPT
jgi:hypothetical protein